MKLPIISSDDGGQTALLFDSVEAATAYIEPVDVLNSEYIGYDSEGRLLHFVARSADCRCPIVIELAEAEPTHADELRAMLVSFLKILGHSPDKLEQATLQELVSWGLKYKTQ